MKSNKSFRSASSEPREHGLTPNASSCSALMVDLSMFDVVYLLCIGSWCSLSLCSWRVIAPLRFFTRDRCIHPCPISSLVDSTSLQRRRRPAFAHTARALFPTNFESLKATSSARKKVYLSASMTPNTHAITVQIVSVVQRPAQPQLQS